MFTNGALKRLIALEEKKPDNGKLITSEYATDEFHVPVPFEWQLGSLFVGVLTNKKDKVSVFMYVGAVDDNRLCVTIEHAPIPLSFTSGSLQQGICKFSKNYNSRANRELLYVPTVLVTRQGMLPVIPLRADQVASCFDEEGGTFKSVRDLFHLYDKQSAPLEKTRNRLFRDWLRAALVSGNGDHSRSQLEVNPTTPTSFTLDQSGTIFNDISEAFHQGEEDNAFGKRIAEGIRNTLAPAFIPEGPPEEGEDVGPENGQPFHPPPTVPPPGGTTNPATTSTPPTTTVPPRTTTTAPPTHQAPATITPSGQTGEEPEVQVLGTRQRTLAFDPALGPHQLAPQVPPPMHTGTHTGRGTLPFNFNFNSHIPGHNHPSTFQTYTNMAGHPGWNNNHLGTGETLGYGGTGIGTNNNMFGMHGPAGPNLHFGSYPSQTGFPFTSGITAAPTTLQTSATQKLQELHQKACNGFLNEADMNALKVLKTTVPTASLKPMKDKEEDMSVQFCNILGWAGFTKEQQHFFHQETNGKWIKYLEATTKAERKAVVNSNFVQPLVQQDPLFSSILTEDFADTILSGQFAPKNYDGMKPSGGLGPLTFISRSTAEHENLQYFNRLNAEATTKTPADIERSKAGSPILPTDIDGTLNVIILNQMAVTSSLTQWSSPAKGIRQLIQVLRANYTRLKSMANFQQTYGNEIIYQLCRHLEKYFNTYCTEQDLIMGNFPLFNIDFLIQGIENNNLSLSYSYGPLFTSPKTAPPASTSPGSRNGQTRNAGTKRNNDGTTKSAPTTLPKDSGKIFRNGQGCEEQKKIIKDYLKTHEYVPKIADIRIANGFNTDKDLSDALGVPEGTCLVWVLYCTCKKRCRRKGTHGFDTTKFKPTKALEILRKGLAM